MRNIRRAMRYLANYWQPTLGGGVALLIVNAANLATPKLLGLLIDQGIILLNLTRIMQVAGGLVAIAVIRGIFNFLQGYWSEMASQGVAYEMRNHIFEKLQKLSFSYHDQAHTGKLMTRMTSDVELVRMFVGRGALMMASALVMIIGTLVLMFQMNWQLAWVVFVTLPVILVFFSVFVRKIMPVSSNVQKKLGMLNSILQENLVGMRVVKSFARENYEIERYELKNTELLAENIGLVKLFVTIFPVIFYIANLGMVAVVWVGGLLVIDLSLTLGELVAFTGYLGFLLMPIFQMGMIGAMLSRAAASAERVFEVIDAQSEVQERTDAVRLPSIEGEVVFEDVSFRYVGGTQDVLKNVSFTAKPGQTIAVLGQTGAGKSSIINLIPRFYDVTGGRVLVDGHDIRTLTVDSLRHQVGIVLQETTLFSGTIRENIAYGRPEASLKDVEDAARAAQAHDFIIELADGYDAIIGERGVGLSGGQKQRVAIARALLIDPRILILDDSTSSVDAETEYNIQIALVKLMQGRTSFVIAQRISTVRNADQILLLDQGRLVAQGQHAQLLETSELYVEILATQFDESRESGIGSRQEVAQ